MSGNGVRPWFRMALVVGIAAAMPLTSFAAPKLDYAYAQTPYVLATHCDLTRPLAFINLNLRNLGDAPTRPQSLEASDDTGTLSGSLPLDPIAAGGSVTVQVPLRRAASKSGALAGIHRVTVTAENRLAPLLIAITPSFCLPIASAKDVNAARAGRLAALAAQPRNTYRLALAVESSSIAAREPLRSGTVQPPTAQTITAHDANLHALEATVCGGRPRLENVIGDLTPGGTITASGSCFGPDRGELQIVGNFPSSNGVVKLAVQSWADDAVTAKVPAITHAPDQAPDVRLGRFVTTMRVRPKSGVPEIYSAPFRMSFLAQSETLQAVTSVTNQSCAPGDRPSNDVCNEGLCGWSICDFGNHTKTGPDAGTDTWRAHFPPGWRFDHIDVQGPAEVVIDRTIDPTNVTWSVRWQTLRTRTEASHVGNHYTYTVVDDGSYLTYVYATGPAGTFPYKDSTLP